MGYRFGEGRLHSSSLELFRLGSQLPRVFKNPRSYEAVPEASRAVNGR